MKAREKGREPVANSLSSCYTVENYSITGAICGISWGQNTFCPQHHMMADDRNQVIVSFGTVLSDRFPAQALQITGYGFVFFPLAEIVADFLNELFDFLTVVLIF